MSMLDLKWNERGLLPAVVLDASSGAALMLAWMNAAALERTLSTGIAHFYSRSRQALWMKGETSGNTLAVREVRADCDGDTICVIAEPAGPACHTGTRSCFFRLLSPNDDGSDVAEDQGPRGAPAAVLDRLESVMIQRRDSSTAEKSYTRSLLDGGTAKILAKISEEHGELAAELDGGSDHAVVHETADLLFHVLAGLVARKIPASEVWSELDRRFGTSGHVEKASREQK